MKGPWANETATLMGLKPGKEPPYFANPVYDSILLFLNIPVNWVDETFNDFGNGVVDVGGSPGDIFYDRREWWAEQNCPQHTFLHDLCHGIVARGKRGDWREHTNFKCTLDHAEEVETCWLQFFLMWHILKQEAGLIIDVMDDYSFFQEIDFDCSNNKWRNCRAIRREVKGLVSRGRDQFNHLLSRSEQGTLRRLAGRIPNQDRRKTVL